MTTTAPKIHACMCKIMLAVDPIAKNKQGHGYKFRGIDDVYIALQHVMAQNGVHATSEILDHRREERSNKTGTTLLYSIITIRWTFWCAEDGSFVKSDTVGEAFDSSDKASNKAMSAADKYALLQAFKIPTDEPKDTEEDNHDAGKQVSKSQQGGARARPNPAGAATPRVTPQPTRLVFDATNPKHTGRLMDRIVARGFSGGEALDLCAILTQTLNGKETSATEIEETILKEIEACGISPSHEGVET